MHGAFGEIKIYQRTPKDPTFKISILLITRMSKTYIVEHLDPELEHWSALEYETIARESSEAGSRFILSSVPKTLQMPGQLRNTPGLTVESQSVEELFMQSKDRVCLLDPAAHAELSPSDGDNFDVFLFGGILGKYIPCSEYCRLLANSQL